MGELRIMTQAGDITLTWEPEDDESTATAHAEWDGLKAAGYEFFTFGTGDRITEWSPDLGVAIAAPGIKKPADKKAGKRKKAMAGGPNAQRGPLVRPGPSGRTDVPIVGRLIVGNAKLGYRP